MRTRSSPRSSPWPRSSTTTRHNSATRSPSTATRRFDARLDRTPLRDYLQRNLKVDWLYDILEAAYVNEFGLNLEDQSSLNFVHTIGTDTSNGFQIYGVSDQRYKVQGGNHQIVAALADQVSDRIALGYQLAALDQRRNGGYVLTFATAPRRQREVTADFVVLCIPFTILRDIDLRVPLPPIKRKAIQELGYGVDAKLILGFQSRLWREIGIRWRFVRRPAVPIGMGQQPRAAELVRSLHDLPGRRPGAGPRRAVRHISRRTTPSRPRSGFPGRREQWLGTALRAYWPSNPFVRASYAAYRPGQWTGIRGAEGRTVGNLYFAGEHTSLDWQGYMNGGAESGRLAAEALIGRFG